ncbi:MAG: CARDB domain-containing protein [Myxococcota bacterium]
MRGRQNGTMQELASGSVVAIDAAWPSLTVVPRVENIGQSGATFHAHVLITLGGVDFYQHTQKLSLAAGKAQSLPIAQVGLDGDADNVVTITVTADAYNAITESDEQNNTCTFEITANLQ